MEYRIKILKNTPFDLEGAVMNLREFRLKYGYICTANVSDVELVEHIKSFKDINGKIALNPAEWFEVIEDFRNLPNAFIHEDIYYTKEFDGFFHAHVSPTHRLQDKMGFKIITIQEASELLTKAKYRQNVIVCTDNVNKKL